MTASNPSPPEAPAAEAFPPRGRAPAQTSGGTHTRSPRWPPGPSNPRGRFPLRTSPLGCQSPRVTQRSWFRDVVEWGRKRKNHSFSATFFCTPKAALPAKGVSRPHAKGGAPCPVASRACPQLSPVASGMWQGLPGNGVKLRIAMFGLVPSVSRSYFGLLGLWVILNFLFLFCICVVSKFSTVNMFVFYNKDRIITTGLSKGSLTTEARATPSCLQPRGPQGHTQTSRSHHWDPGLGRADAGFPW